MTNSNYHHQWIAQQENHREAMKQANLHMDAQDVPEDSILRGLADVSIAAFEIPMLHELLTGMWPNPQSLTN